MFSPESKRYFGRLPAARDREKDYKNTGATCPGQRATDVVNVYAGQRQGGESMIFGGYGRKSKVRGEVFYPCTRCSALNTFALLEIYGYGQLYGVRLAKYKTDRYMVCSHCKDSYPLDKAQWEQARLVAGSLKSRGYELSLKEMAESAVELARKVHPDIADSVRKLLWEQLDELPPAGDGADTEQELIAALAELEAGDETKICPDCAEQVKEAARKCRFCGYRFEPDVGADAASDLAS